MHKVLLRLLSAVAALFVFYLAFSIYQSNVASTRTKADRERATGEVSAAIRQVALKDGAGTGWPDKLSGGKADVDSPLLTAELQQVWITGRPILFIGKLNDIARNADGSYQLFVEYTSNENRPWFLKTKLQVRLDCPEATGKSLMDSVAGHRDYFGTDVAVTATVRTVEASSTTDAESAAISVLTGRGECVTVMLLPEAMRY
jgi:type II secretory pathway pseudopilin PulG